MSTAFWGFPLLPSLYADAQEAIASTLSLDETELSQGTRIAFDLISKLIFAAINVYYATPIDGRLPPLPAKVTQDEAIESVGLGLVFVAGRYLQGRSVRELKDLAHYLERLLLLHPQTGEPYLALPLPLDLETRTREILTRAQRTSEILSLRDEIHSLILDIVEASVSYYFVDAESQEPDQHLQQVIYYGIRDISDAIAQLADQLLPTLPPEYLLHFFRYVEAMFFQMQDS